MPTVSRTSRKRLILFAVLIVILELLNLMPESAADIVHPTAVLSCSLLVAWALSIHRRILQPSVRRMLIAVAAAMILLFVLALSRWQFFAWSPAANRLLWYAYYIPFTFVPLLSFTAALRVGKQESEKNAGILYLLWPVWGLLCVLFMTNGIHGRLLRHLSEHGDDVSYGWLYGVTVAWSALLVIAFFLVLLRRSRLARVKRLWFVPTAAFAVSVALLAWYFAAGGAPTIGNVKLFNLQEAFSFVVVLIWESVIQTGLVPANSDYEELFRISHLNAAIADEQGSLAFVSVGSKGTEGAHAPECFAAQGSPSDAGTAAKSGPADSDCVLKSAPAPGGTVYWTEDRGAILSLNNALQEATETLEGENDLISEENRISAEKARYEAENRLYDRISGAVRPELERVDETLADEDTFRASLKSDMVLGAYIKRRANLELLARESGTLSSDELWYAIRESDEFLSLSGVSADVLKNGEADIPSEALLLAYDFFESVVESSLAGASAYSAVIGAEGGPGAFSLTVAADMPGAFSAKDWRPKELAALGMTASARTEDETSYYTISAESKGAESAEADGKPASGREAAR